VRERQRADLARYREQNRRWPTFETWLRERRNPELAERWRFRDRAPAVIIGDRESDARPHDIRAFSGEVRGWEVAYRRTGSLRAPSFVDRGREIRIHDLQRDSVLAALQLSAQKWGTFQVFGSDAYKRLCAELAAEHGFRLANPELQQVIEIARERRHQIAPPRETLPDRSSRPPEPTLDPRTRGRGRGLGR
jgi:Large polyvalent protein-associated domain 7